MCQFFRICWYGFRIFPIIFGIFCLGTIAASWVWSPNFWQSLIQKPVFSRVNLVRYATCSAYARFFAHYKLTHPNICVAEQSANLLKLMNLVKFSAKIKNIFRRLRRGHFEWNRRHQFQPLHLGNTKKNCHCFCFFRHIEVDSFGSKLIPFNLYVLGLQYSQLASS